MPVSVDMQLANDLWWCRKHGVRSSEVVEMVELLRTSESPAELLVAFANSEDHEEGTDDLTTTAELASWLAGHGLAGRRVRATAEDLALARDLRAALHAAMVANHDRSVGLAGRRRRVGRRTARTGTRAGRRGRRPAAAARGRRRRAGTRPCPQRGAWRPVAAAGRGQRDRDRRHLGPAEDLLGRRLPLGLPGPDEEPVPGLVRVGLRQQGQDPRLPGPQEGRRPA